jgi:hypothetical protein
MLNVANRMGGVSTITEPDRPLAEPEPESPLQVALKQSASALKADGVPFALGGGYALWGFGAPEPTHDVDLVVTERDVPRAVDCLAAAGFEIERPPEDWLFKAWLDGALVDVLHRVNGVVVTDSAIADAQELELLGLRLPVLPPTPIMIAKLRSLTEHYCDFTPLIPVVRAVREQLHWDEIREQTRDEPYAEAFVFLVDRLRLTD